MEMKRGLGFQVHPDFEAWLIEHHGLMASGMDYNTPAYAADGVVYYLRGEWMVVVRQLSGGAGVPLRFLTPIDAPVEDF